MSSFYDDEELAQIGLLSYGFGVRISRKTSIYNAAAVKIGNNVRIDDYCILSGMIVIDNNIHIAAYSALFAGDAGIYISDFANVSSRVCIYAISDDFSGNAMTNPTIPDRYRHVVKAPVRVGKHVIIGSGSTILPGVTLSEGTGVGAMSLIKETTKEWSIYAGIPARIIRERSNSLLSLEKEYMEER